MRILGIETSCDETAIAIVTKTGDRLAVELSAVLSQVKIHAAYGGVVPEVAARKHLEAVFPMLEHAVSRSGAGIDAIAVTAGPGLAPALRTGVEVAKTLAWGWQKPLVPVNHLEGHIYGAWLPEGTPPTEPLMGAVPSFPALCLLVSGGHTELVTMHTHGTYERIGETLDDAAGEAFDKTAKMLGLPYPGGPEIARRAEVGNAAAFDFPRGLLDRKDLNFSFSGLKTSVLYMLRTSTADLSEPQFIADVAASVQEAIVDVLVQKTMRAAGKVAPKSIILAGGVSANKALRKRMAEACQKAGIPLFVPPFVYSMDNAAMIAAAGAFRAMDARQMIDPRVLRADPNLELGET